MRAWHLAVVGALLGSVGCFPIDLEANSKGELLVPRQEGFFLFDPVASRVTRLRAASAGEVPCFARFSPDERSVLLVSEVTEKGDDFSFDPKPFRFYLVSLADGKSRTIFKTKRACNACFSPDGKKLAVAQVKGSFAGTADIYVIDLKSGQATKALASAGNQMKWFSDSRRMVVYLPKSPPNDDLGTGHLREGGDLAILDTETKQATRFRTVVANTSSTMDLSKDNTKLLFTATSLVPSQQTYGKLRLFEYDFKTTVTKVTDKEASFARYSPDGSRVLIVTPPPESGLAAFSKAAVMVGDASLDKFETVATEAYHEEYGSLRPEWVSVPGWISNDRVFYFVERRVFGSQGTARHMVTVKVDGTDRRFVQPKLDGAIDAMPDPLHPKK